eukprot:gene9262-biopygen22700
MWCGNQSSASARTRALRPNVLLRYQQNVWSLECTLQRCYKARRLELDPVDGENRYKGSIPCARPLCSNEQLERLSAINVRIAGVHMIILCSECSERDPVRRVEGGSRHNTVSESDFLGCHQGALSTTPALQGAGPGPGTGHPPKSSSLNGPLRHPLMCYQDLDTYFVAGGSQSRHISATFSAQTVFKATEVFWPSSAVRKWPTSWESEVNS